MAAAGGGGGAGTGGKIRTRRNHPSSGRTPYSKNRQQGQQQGIISRVTDTVKNIVPAWLQRYFNKEEEVPGRSSNLDRVVDRVHDRENEEQSQVYVQDDLPADGRITPEPVRTQEDLSTSRLTLNLPDVLTRPSLHRANLNFNILDSPALNCQPSTSSSSYPIGTSNFSLVKEIKDSTSQHDDDNISTTSGFSSRASDKDIIITKSMNAPPLWSPEANLSHNSSMNSRKPMFNLSTFGALSPSLGNSSVLKSGHLGDSPFYPGKTTYGGAAAARTSRIRSTPYQPPIRRQVKPKPANNQSYGVTSSTARRILQSLEKMSSPLADARRIPSISSPTSLTPEKSFVDVADSSFKRKKVEASYPPVKKLVTPRSVSVSTNASLYIKPSLTPSSIANAGTRRIQGSDKHKEAPKSHAPDAPRHTESFSYPKFSTPASNGFPSGRCGGKMMREKGSHYTTKSPDEEVEAPDLPEISLPISTTALPKISFGFQTKTTPPPAAVGKPVFSTAKATNSPSNPEFTFSSPIVKSTESKAQSPGSSVGFTFSVPSMKVSSFSSQTSKISAMSSPAPVAISSSNVKKTEEEYSGFCKPAKTLKEGSVLDILKSPGFSASSTSQQTTTTLTPSKSMSSPLARPPAGFGESSKQALGIWYCSKCLIDNKASDSKCKSCSTPKELPPAGLKESATSAPSTPVKNTTVTNVQGFGNLFKKALGTWDCDTCLVQNKPESTKCIACETPNPGTGAKASLLLFPTTKSDKHTAPADNGLTSASLKFEELARKSIGSWECDVCLVQNKAEDGKCIACTTPKPGTLAPVNASTFPTHAPEPQHQLGLLDQFKKASGTWDCDVCLVNNKAEVVKCVACQSAKPGSKVELTGLCTLPGSSESTLPTIKFGLPSSSNSGELKSSASTDSLASKPGGFSFPKFSGEIKFGVTSSPSKSTDEKKDTGFTFGTPSSTSNSSSTSNLFGFSKPAPADKDAIAKPLSGENLFASSATAPKPGTSECLSSNEKSNLTVSFGFTESREKKTEAPVASGFTFGKTEQKETTSTFVFGKKDEKSETTTAVISAFGSKNEGDQPKQYVFGKPEDPKSDAPASVSFSFGVPNTAEKKDSDQTAKPVFSFGLPTPATGATKPFGFGFQSNGSSTAPQPSSIGSSGSVFGSVQQPSTQSSTGVIFGSAVQSDGTSGSSGFGSTALASAPTSTGFSSSAALPAPAGSSSLIASTTALNTPANSSTIFGSVAPSIAASGSSSVFGGAAPVNTISASSAFGASTNTSVNSSSLFGNSSTSTNSSAAPFVFGQPATTASGTLFVNPNESKTTFFSGPESKPAVTSTSTAPACASPFLFGANAPSTTPAAPSFNFTGANTSNVTGTNSSPFIFGAAGAPAPAAAASPVPTFGKPASQTNAPPAFGSSASTGLFPTTSQNVPAFGSLNSNVQTPVFGQQSSQPGFGSNAAPASGTGFPFGSSNFNFTSGSSPGVFQFGVNPAPAPAPAQPANSGFVFNQPPTFNMGANGRTTTPSTITNRKIRTARRRK
ncbi:nuclear pore complex protein Nup153 [Rhinoderma darwinii]|uniref:nuclear pore complex protein Nup153 n=1 Tax=Rhinoderma darwinii TaxID=43563 RepID=UPI003F678C5D